MYYLNKIIGFLVSPIGVAIAGGLLAILCARLRRKRLAKWLGGATVVWLWLWMTPIMTWVVGIPLEREFLVDGKVPAVESFPAADAIVLLGGGMGIDTNLSQYAEMWTSADRVWQAARLWKAGKAKKIIATGDYAVDTTLPLLLDMGVAKDDVVFMDARNTEEEAKGIRELFSRVEHVERVEGKSWRDELELESGGDDSRVEHVKERGGVGELEPRNTQNTRNVLSGGMEGENGEGKRTILLVTSAWHMKRARLMFEKYAPELDVVCAPADFENTITAARGFSLLPDPNVFTLNSVAFHEWVGIVGYAVFR